MHEFPVVGLVKLSFMDIKQNDFKIKNYKHELILKAGGKWCFVLERFSKSTSWDIHEHFVFFLMVVWRSCDGTYNCNFKYIFIFHFSQLSLTLFVQNSFLGLFGGSASLWKKWFQNSTHLLFWTYMYFCNVLKNQYKKANTSINVAIALWLKQLFVLNYLIFLFFYHHNWKH